MTLKVGDLVVCPSGLPGVVLAVINSSIFEGGESNLLLTVLTEDKKFELMAWEVKKVNA